jgi:hypothetical protein
MIIFLCFAYFTVWVVAKIDSVAFYDVFQDMNTYMEMPAR